MQLGLRLLDVRPSLEQRRRHPRRRRRRGELVADGASAGHGRWTLAEEHAERVLRLFDGALGVGDDFSGLRDQDLGLVPVDQRGHATGHAHPHQAQRILAAGQRLKPDVALEVERTKEEIHGGDVAHERRDHETPRLLGGQQLRARGLGAAPEAAPEVDLEADVEPTGPGERVPELERRPAALDVRPRPRGGRIDERELERAHDRHLGARIQNARRRNTQVVVLAQGDLDQVAKDLVLEEVPPCHVGEGLDRASIAGRRATEGRRRRHRRPSVVGTQGAACQHERRCHEHAAPHACCSVGTWPGGGSGTAGCTAAARRRPSRSTNAKLPGMRNTPSDVATNIPQNTAVPMTF